MPVKLYAVLIADIVSSSAQRRLRSRLGTILALASRRHLRRKFICLPYSVTAGDEFQTVCADVRSLPQLILDLRVLLQPLPLRIGIGIGRIADRIEPPVNRLSGEAFQRARAAIDTIKFGGPFKFATLTYFVSPDASLDETLNLIYGLNDTLLSGVTHKQWNTIAAFTQNSALANTSRQLHRDASTISRNLKRGYYWQLSETVRTAGPLLSRAFG